MQQNSLRFILFGDSLKVMTTLENILRVVMIFCSVSFVSFFHLVIRHFTVLAEAADALLVPLLHLFPVRGSDPSLRDVRSSALLDGGGFDVCVPRST